MKWTRVVLNGCLTVAAAAVSGSLAIADVKVNPYESIAERNPFALKPPPPPAPPEDPSSKAPPTPPATVELTGITSILKSKKALLEIIPGPGKPTIKHILSEGERIEAVEVVTIDIDKNEVTIKNGALLTNLTFKVAKSSDKPAAPPGVPPPPVPGSIPGLPGAVPPPAAGLPGAPQSAFGNQDGGGRGVQVGGGADGFRSIPSRGIRTGAAQQQQQQQMTAEQSVFEVERNRIINEQVSQNTGIRFPPLPPTPLNPNPQDGVINDSPSGLTPSQQLLQQRMRNLPKLPPIPGQ